MLRRFARCAWVFFSIQVSRFKIVVGSSRKAALCVLCAVIGHCHIINGIAFKLKESRIVSRSGKIIFIFGLGIIYRFRGGVPLLGDIPARYLDLVRLKACGEVQ